MMFFTFSSTVASSLAYFVDCRICSSNGVNGFCPGGDLKVTLLARRGEFLLKASEVGVILFGLDFGDLLGLSNVSAPTVGRVLALAWFGADRPFHVFLVVGGNLGVDFGEVVRFGVCLGLGVFARDGVLARTGE